MKPSGRIARRRPVDAYCDRRCQKRLSLSLIPIPENESLRDLHAFSREACAVAEQKAEEKVTAITG